jgi:hypothetical protein
MPSNISSIRFDGISGQMTVTDYKGVTGRIPRSIAFWMKTPASGVANEGTICYWGNELDTGSLRTGTTTKVGLVSGGKDETHAALFGLGSFRESDDDVGDGKWHHVCFTWPGGKKTYGSSQCYIDGALSNGPSGKVSGSENINTPETQDVTLGCEPSVLFGNQEFFAGQLDDFCIFSTDIGSVGASQLAASGHGNIDIAASGIFSSNLAVWYRMGDVPGDTAGDNGTIQDASGNGRDAATTAGTTLLADPGPEVY